NLQLNDFDLEKCDKAVLPILKSQENEKENGIYDCLIYDDVFFSELLHPCKQFDFFANTNTDKLANLISNCAYSHKEISRAIYNFLIKENKEAKTVKELNGYAYLCDTALVIKSDFTKDEAKEVFWYYINVLSSYNSCVFNPEVFNEDDIDVLPQRSIFAFYASLAFNCKEKNDNAGYLKNLRKAIRYNEGMREIVSILLSEIQLQLENSNAISSEFAQLAKSVKEQLKAFIKQKDFKSADEILTAYAKINPNDPDLVEITEQMDTLDK
ncbi:MAG: hypothetical protein RR052_07035, partial [Oscillospiraceae bacterium]